MQQNKVILWLSNSRFKIEIVLAVLIAIAAWLNYLKIAGGQEMLMILMSTLAGFYFVSGIFFEMKIKGTMIIIAYRVFAIASAVCVNGLLYAILHLVGASQTLLIGATAMGASGLMILSQGFGSGSNSHLPTLIRLALLGPISVSTLTALSKQAAI